MTIITVIGIAADELGHSLSTSAWLDERGAAHRGIDAAAVPASAYRVTKANVPVDWRHDRYLGEIVHIERRHNLTVVAEIDIDRCAGIDLFEHPLFWSPETWEERHRHGVEAELLAIALTATPASLGLRPVDIVNGDIVAAGRRATGPLAGILERAAQARRRRHHGDPLRIVDIGSPTLQRNIDGMAFVGDQLITEKRMRRPLADDARRLGITQVEYSHHRGRVIGVH